MKLKLLITLLFSILSLQNLFCQCLASFSVSGNPCSKDSLIFTFTGNGDSLQWNFGDIPSGSLNESNANAVWHKFSTSGNYNIQLIVSDTSGCKDTTIQIIKIYNNPTINFNVENTCVSYLTSFINQSTADIGDSLLTYYYTFGDGGNAAIPNTTHTYSTAGTKGVKLLIYTTKGCKDSITKSIAIFNEPIIVKAIDSVCQGTDLNIDVNHGSDLVSTYLWNLGDASSNNNKYFIHQYNSPGTKRITLKLTYSNGSFCNLNPDSTLVFEKPNSNFIINTLRQQCFKGNLNCITFGKDSTGVRYRNILWDDGSSNNVAANLTSTCYTYTNKNGGKYRITNEVIDSNGCANRTTVLDTITIYKDPKANFSIIKTGGCFKTFANVTNTSNMAPPKVKKFNWNWGDGTADDSLNWNNTQHTYIANGSFKIRLSIIDTFNCYDTLLSNGNINNTNYIVDARLDQVIDSCRITNVFNFKQTPIPGGTSRWYFGNTDSVVNSWSFNFSYTKGIRIGTYLPYVRLSKNGCDSIIRTKPAIVYGPFANATILNRYQCQIKDTVKFVNATVPYKNKFLTTFWDANDPFASNCTIDSKNNLNVDSNCNLSIDSLKFKHFYKPGKENCYYLNFTEIDSALGCKDVARIAIPLMPPDASTGIDILSNGSFCLGPEVPKRVNLNLNRTIPNCDRENYWVMWDSLCAEQSGNFNANWRMRELEHNYNYVPCDSNGRVTIGIIIQNGRDTLGNFCRDTAFYHHVVKFGVLDPRFTSSFDVLSNYCKNSTFEFGLKDSTLDSITNIVWNYGDGTIENNLFLGKRFHKYKNRGLYTVTVTLTHKNGCTGNNTMQIRVGAQPRFLLNKNKICVADTLLITNNTRYWNGAAYWNDSLRQAQGKETTRWDIGDGNGFSITGSKAPIFYNKIGNYNVKFEYTDSAGCIDTFNLPLPIRVFNVFSDITLPPNQLICAQVVQFKSSASVYDSLNNFGHTDDSLIDFSWFFDNNTSNSVLKNPFKYLKGGWHNVKLIAKNTIGCKDEYTDSIFIKGPLAKFSIISDTVGCMPLNVVFKNNSIDANSYTWLYKNANNNTTITGSNANINFAYTAYGNYRPQLIARNTFLNNGINVTCADTMVPNASTAYSPVILVYEKPRPNFIHATNCANYTTQFSNTSALTTSLISKYEWFFGDGDSSQARNPLHQFLDSGRYRIVLKAYSPNGCVDSIVRNIFVYPFPAANFTFNNVCFGKAVNFKDISLSFNDVLTSWTWNFGNGAINNTRNPNYIYPIDSVSYNVRLTVTNRSGCSNAITKQVKVYAKPKPNFTPTNVCLKSPTLYSNIGISKQGNAYNTWTLGNGISKISSYFNYVYTDTGIYIVKLKATSIHGCEDSITKSVRVFTNPKSNFTVNNTIQCTNQNKFIFTNTSSINSGNIANTIWQLSDSYGASSTHLTYKFLSNATYSARLISRSNNNCYDTILKYVTVKPSPIAIINIDKYERCIDADSFVFTDKSTIDTTIASRNWKFTTSNFSANKTVKFKFATSGNYPIRLSVSNTSGCADTANTYLLVHPKPKAFIGKIVNEQCFKGNKFVLKDSSKIAAGYFLNTKWQLGNTDSSIFSTFNYSYLNADTFKIRLISTSNKFCKDTANLKVVVHPMPVALFSIDNANQCLKNNFFNFTNTSTILKSNLSYNWRFGDAVSASTKNTTHSYAYFNPFTVWLRATSTFGCKDSVNKLVNVYAMPKANFKLVDTASCYRNNKVVAINASSIGQGSYTNYWFTLPKNQVAGDTFRVSYMQDSVFKIKLKTVSSFGCTDSIIKNTYIYPMPITKFKVDSAAQCLRGNKFKFTNNSAAKDSLKYIWNFGNGISSKAKDTSIKFSNYGSYNVLLISNSVRGCKDSQLIKLTIHSMPKAIVGVNDSLQCFNTQNFVFTDKSKIPFGSLKRQWQWYDNTVDTNKIRIKYLIKDSTFKSKLIAISGKQCADTFIFNTTAHSVPKSNFSINDSDQCLPIQNFVFSNLSNIKKGTINYTWLTGDGFRSAATSVNYRYNTSANYTVQLKAISNFGCRDSLAKKTIVFHQPKAKLTVVDSAQCMRFNLFKMIGNSTIAQGSIVAYNWDTSGANFNGPQNANFSYKTNGSKSIRYIVQSNNICYDTIYQKLTVHPMPKANFAVNNPIQCVQNNAFQFNANSTIVYGSMRHYWQVDNGVKDSGLVFNKSFNQTDTINIKMVSISDKQCSDTMLKTIYVQPTPKAAFSINDSGQCLKVNNFIFANKSQVGHGILTYLWQFGDFNKDTAKNITHQYLKHGNYNVKLKITSNYNCSDSAQLKILVHPEPLANFLINNDTQCLKGNSFVFNNTSTIDSTTLNYLWRLGDNTNSNIKDITKTYTNFNPYNVSLIVKSNYNCSDSIKKPILVNAMPVAAFNINDSGQCLKVNNFSFDNKSTIPLGKISHLWQFADLNKDTAKNTIHTYTQHGNYNVKLNVESAFGCKDSAIVKVLVHPEPLANFLINNDTQCLKGNSFVFNNTSTIDSTTLNYLWRLGDNTNSNIKDITKTYTNFNPYNVSLIVKSNYNCSDSIKKPILVNAMPVAAFKINDSGQCLKTNNFSFDNKSTIPLGKISHLWHFADLNKDTAKNTIHTYTQHGNYNVKLNVESAFGCKDSAIVKVLVHPEPIANFSINKNSQCLLNNIFAFNNLTTIDSTTLSYFWKFNDNSISINTNPTKKYTKDGQYSVTLITKSKYNCTDSSKLPIFVNPMPKAKFGINDSTQCINNQAFSFTDNSTLKKGNIDNYEWQIANLQFNTKNVNQLKLPNSGIKHVQHIVISDSLCSDTANSKIRVYAKPVANFVINDSVQCLTGNKFIFTSTSVDSLGINLYDWRINNIPENTSQVYTKSFTMPAKYNVQLLLNNIVGCKDTIVQKIRVKSMPNPAFNTLKPYYCNSENPFMLVPVTAGGLFSGKNIMGSTLVPNILFKDTVKYTVTVEGCTTTSQQYTDIYPFPYINLGADSTMCKNESVILKATNWNSIYKWQDGSSDAEYLALKAGKYWVTATNLCGSFSDSIDIQFRDKNCRLWLPTAFSPNRDGKNEVYKPITYGVTEMYYEIFNRWGEKVFVGDLNSPGWDATYMGEPVMESYFLIIVNYSFVNSGKKFNFTEKEVFYLLK